LSLESLVPLVVTAIGTIAIGFLINLFTPLIGFRAAMVCAWVALAAGAIQLAYVEPVVTMLGPLAQGDAMVGWRIAAALLGGLVFLGAAVLVEHSFGRLQKKLQR
jgi:hypothetical protein